jgi:hypothetical protein
MMAPLLELSAAQEPIAAERPEGQAEEWFLSALQLLAPELLMYRAAWAVRR